MRQQCTKNSQMLKGLTLAASVQQRIACGERAGHKVRRLGAGLGSAGEAPMLTGPHCASVQGCSVHAHT